MSVTDILNLIKEFGFPIFVAIWALWRLDKNWAKGDNVQARLDQIDESLDRIEMAMTKQAEVTQEMLITMRLTTQLAHNNNNGGGNK